MNIIGGYLTACIVACFK